MESTGSTSRPRPDGRRPLPSRSDAAQRRAMQAALTAAVAALRTHDARLARRRPPAGGV